MVATRGQTGTDGPACPRVATMISRFQSISLSPSKFRDCRGITLLALASSRSRITATHWYASRISWTNPQSASVASCWCRPGGVSKSSSLHRLSRGFSLDRRPVSNGTSLSAVHYILDFLSRARPSLRNAPRLPLLLSLLQRWFRSTAGAAILYLPSCPDVGGPPSLSPIRLSSITPTLP